ncbi:helix-turn-helix domain-containing protein [Pseudofrankia asymbiotica]|uniref:TetR family transcriptional regulator n=1 Tax=Pseudofrankia asymbiotica TaxID=1834516 RepID=A0A1V2IJH4_9ACTN|nr:TetR/AcrR family transcriptional regulator [Pseudofrankia asymbiotica]ONH33362.1 TetR family transcriptional regulator [Pseudofrankia asymbiotica]
MTAEARPRLRADARRNRDRIIATATQAFADDGPDVPMEEIARLAGVGVGTLYRRFPDREALVVAVVRDSLATTLARARAAADSDAAAAADPATKADPATADPAAAEGRAWDALVNSLNPSHELRLTMRLTSLFSPTTAAAVRADPAITRIRREYAETLDALVLAAQAEGSLRPDVGSGDVAHLLSLAAYGLSRAPDATAEIAFDRARAIILDGLRAHPTAPLPGHPLTTTDLASE